MRILFTTQHKTAVSTVLNIGRLQDLNMIDGVTIEFFNENYQDYDVVLFMGYDYKIEEAKAINPKIKVGVIDPRAASEKQPVGADFILANGIEMRDWCVQFTPNVFIYYIYPVLENKLPKPQLTQDRIILGYHGNKVHLMEMYPRITRALEMLGDKYTIEFWAMYNIEQLGQWKDGLPDASKVPVKHIQWSEANYAEYMSQVNIGIIPNLIPVTPHVQFTRHDETSSMYNRVKALLRRGNFRTNPVTRLKKTAIYQEHETDYLIRYKATSNAGRIFVFAQYGIPVVADMFPSTLQFINDSVDGFVCYSTEAWFWALRKLVDNSARLKMGQALQEKFYKDFSVSILNERLIRFIEALD